MSVAPSVEAGAEDERTGPPPPQDGGESSVFVGIMTPISGETEMDCGVGGVPTCIIDPPLVDERVARTFSCL